MENHASSIINVDYLNLVFSAGLVIVAGVVSILLRLGLEKRLLVASIRTVVQLLLIGYVLRYVFMLENVWLILALALVMIFIAARAAVGRSKRSIRGIRRIAFGTLAVVALLTTFSVTKIIVGVQPWYRPQYMIPLLGMILGNSLTALSLCIDHVLESFSQRADEIEAELAMGASAWEAARPALREGVRKGMIPIINSMTVVGLVSLPGMMTGQILSGTEPIIAVKYQIVVMFMLAGAISAASIGIALLVYKRTFNSRHQLLSSSIKVR